MRVLILGTVVNEKTSGGVAVFDESLYKGFTELGDVVNILSINKSSSINNIVVDIKKPKPFKILFHFKRISREIKKYKPDLVISSLQYSIGIKKYKRTWPEAKYIQVLHGFPCPSNGSFKSFIVNRVAKYSRKHFDYLVTVSFLSYAVNKKINRIICDKVIYNGCALDLNSTANDSGRPYDFIYIGRLFKDKEVEMIGEAFRQVKNSNNNFRVAIAGYGELESMFTKGKFKDSGIEFLGKLTQSQVKDYLRKSKFFISLNPLEPFGIVFNEALLCGCNIITQSSSGCSPLYIKGDYFHIADSTNSKDLFNRLLNIHKHFHRITKSELKMIADYSSYKRVASEYRELVNENKHGIN